MTKPRKRLRHETSSVAITNELAQDASKPQGKAKSKPVGGAVSSSVKNK